MMDGGRNQVNAALEVINKLTSVAGGGWTSVLNMGVIGGGLLGGGSLRARRLQRQQEAQAAEAAAAAKLQAEQAERDAERRAQAEQEKQQREAERAEQRQQLLAIQEELKRVRESKAPVAKGASEDGGGGANNETE